MALDLNAPLDQIIALLKTISGLEDVAGVARVRKGVPESLETRTSVYVALAQPSVSQFATQQQLVEATYWVGFGYRTENAEATAEENVCTFVAAFAEKMAIAANRTLSNTVDSATLEFPAVGGPQYQIMAGQEHRVLPALVRTRQRIISA